MEFIESICFRDGEYQNLELHQERMNHTCFHFFGEALHSLQDILPPLDTKAKAKVRVVYDGSDYQIDHDTYVKKPIRSLQILETDWFDYSFKYADRSLLDGMLQSSGADEILISVDGMITDSSYANLLFWNGSEWLTPEQPLLAGVKRASLLKRGKIREAPIRTSELGAYEKVSLVNAMLDPDDLEFPMSAVS